MGHVVRMTMTGAMGITFVILVDAAERGGVWRYLFAVGADGVIYAQAAVAVIVGIGAALWGWYYVGCLSRTRLPALDLERPRPYAHADRFRRR